jgi:hypothetical protein
LSDSGKEREKIAGRANDITVGKGENNRWVFAGRNLRVLITVILRVFYRAKARDFSVNFDGFLTFERGASDWFHDDFFWSTNKINDYRTPLRHDFLMGSSF